MKTKSAQKSTRCIWWGKTGVVPTTVLGVMSGRGREGTYCFAKSALSVSRCRGDLHGRVQIKKCIKLHMKISVSYLMQINIITKYCTYQSSGLWNQCQKQKQTIESVWLPEMTWSLHTFFFFLKVFVKV